MADPQQFFEVGGNTRTPAQVKGYLAELDDLNERLFFHFNPTSYEFDKEANYEEDLILNDFVESVAFKGIKAMPVTFDLFLNEIDMPRPIQRSVEGSISWLCNRMGPVEKGRKANGSWLSIGARAAASHVKNVVPPPALVLVGLRDVFTCVLTRVKVVSTFQRSNTVPFRPDASRNQTSRQADLIKLAPAPFRRGEFELPKPGDITRATVSITLKEFIESPI